MNADLRAGVLRFAGLTADDQALLLKIHDLIGSIPFGTIELVMHEGEVVQIETSEKFRLDVTLDQRGGRPFRRLSAVMPATVVLGTQWGDEGKGKAVDYLADRMDFVVRYQGGNNAGHTIIAEGRLLKLNLVPSGVLYPHITNVIADGVVVDPAVLLRELDELTRLRGRRQRAQAVAERAPDHAVPPRAGEGDPAVPRLERARHDQARDRARLRRPRRPRGHPGPGPLRREDPARQARRGPQGEEPDPDQGLRAAGDRAGADLLRLPGLRRAAASACRRHRPAAARGRWWPAST